MDKIWRRLLDGRWDQREGAAGDGLELTRCAEKAPDSASADPLANRPLQMTPVVLIASFYLVDRGLWHRLLLQLDE